MGLFGQYFMDHLMCTGRSHSNHRIWPTPTHHLNRAAMDRARGPWSCLIFFFFSSYVCKFNLTAWKSFQVAYARMKQHRYTSLAPSEGQELRSLQDQQSAYGVFILGSKTYIVTAARGGMKGQKKKRGQIHRN